MTPETQKTVQVALDRILRELLDLQQLISEDSGTGFEPADRLLDVGEVAERLGISAGWVYRHPEAFPACLVKLGGLIKYSERGLHALIRSGVIGKDKAAA